MKVVAIVSIQTHQIWILLSHILCLSQKPDNWSSNEEDDEYMLERLNNTDWYVYTGVREYILAIAVTLESSVLREIRE